MLKPRLGQTDIRVEQTPRPRVRHLCRALEGDFSVAMLGTPSRYGWWKHTDDMFFFKDDMAGTRTPSQGDTTITESTESKGNQQEGISTINNWPTVYCHCHGCLVVAHGDLFVSQSAAHPTRCLTLLQNITSVPLEPVVMAMNGSNLCLGNAWITLHHKLVKLLGSPCAKRNDSHDLFQIANINRWIHT